MRAHLGHHREAEQQEIFETLKRLYMRKVGDVECMCIPLSEIPRACCSTYDFFAAALLPHTSIAGAQLGSTPRSLRSSLAPLRAGPAPRKGIRIWALPLSALELGSCDPRRHASPVFIYFSLSYFGFTGWVGW